MKEEGDRELLLGRHTPVVDVYSPQLLYPIPRSAARDTLGLAQELPFAGVDIWHAYELSWLDSTGKPVSRVGRFTVDARSPNIVESKSFKLYLNSLNNTRFDSDLHALQLITADVGAVAGHPVELQLFGADDPALAGASLAGQCIDSGSATVTSEQPNVSMLTPVEATSTSEHCLYSHLLRSLCPVTGQPDWATLWLHYRGLALTSDSLLQYILAYRQHQEFHEQCVERIFCDIADRVQPEFLHIQAFYTRRGGLDINPFRSTNPDAKALPRLNRQ